MAVIIYTYVGYPLLLLVFTRFIKRTEVSSSGPLPTLTVVIPCFNEAAVIREKLENTIRLQYDPDRVKILCVTDGSTDETNDIISEYPMVRLLSGGPRAGKSEAENRAMKVIDTELVVFCDANAMLNDGALIELAKCFANPKVGAVSGEKRLQTFATDGAVASEGAYWKYESFIKQLDYKLYTVVGAAGELFALRSVLYTEMPGDTINDDLTQSLSINLKGYRVAYSSKAYAMERPSDNVREEQKRKIRMIAGAWQMMTRFPQTMNLWKHPLLAFQFISHRVLRWTLCPLAIPAAALTAVCLYMQEPGNLQYICLFLGTLLFSTLTALGYILRNSEIRIGVISIAYYFIFMNYCAWAGFIKFLKGQQKNTWERSARKV